jgi:hypothetical protein
MKGKSFVYQSTNTSTHLHTALCIECFADPKLDFKLIFDLYTNKGTYPHENFTDSQLDLLIEGLVTEVKSNATLQEKYRQYIMEQRDQQLEKLFGEICLSL